MEIRMAGGVFELGNPEGRGGGAQALEIQLEAGVKKPCLPSGGEWCGFVPEITQFRE